MLYKFKVLKMSDERHIDRNKSQSYISLQIEDKEKDLLWREEFAFEMHVPTDPDKRPYIYFNKDLTLMLVQYNNDFSADIFKIADVKYTSRSSFVNWELKYHINRYPVILKGRSCANFLFSPSFERYIDIDYSKQEFVIRQSSNE